MTLELNQPAAFQLQQPTMHRSVTLRTSPQSSSARHKSLPLPGCLRSGSSLRSARPIHFNLTGCHTRSTGTRTPGCSTLSKGFSTKECGEGYYEAERESARTHPPISSQLATNHSPYLAAYDRLLGALEDVKLARAGRVFAELDDCDLQAGLFGLNCERFR